jgi:hypothetical protein
VLLVIDSSLEPTACADDDGAHFFFGVGARCGRSERRRFAAAGLGAAFFADAGFLTADLGFFADAGFFLAEALALRGVACRGVL